MVHINLTHGLLWPTLHAFTITKWAFLICALLAGGLVKGIVSIGVPLIAVPLLTGILTVKQTVLLLSMPIIIGNIPQALEGGETWKAINAVKFLIIGTIIGIAIGVKILLAIPTHTASFAAGLVLAIACASMLLAPRFTLPLKFSGAIGFAAGLISGLMEGIAAIPGPLLATYLIAKGSIGKRFTKEIALVLVVSIAVLIGVFGQSRNANASDVLISVVASIPVVIGILLGRPLRDALPPKLFRSIVLVFIFLAAVQMIYRSGFV